MKRGCSVRGWYFLVILMAFSIGSCASQEERRLKKIQTNYPQWDHATIKKLAALQIEPGMTKEMVSAALGKPGEETVKDGETRWEYNEYTFSEVSGVRIVSSYFVYFKDGKVTRTLGDPTRIGIRPR